jgi:hypothetical protein
MASSNNSSGIGEFIVGGWLRILESGLTQIDMNDESILQLYSCLLLFKNDVSQPEIKWQDPDYGLQRALQSLAHKLNLEYEYSLHTRVAHISRTTVPEVQMDLGTGDTESFKTMFRESNINVPGKNFGVPELPLHDAMLSSTGSSSQFEPHISTPLSVPEPSMVFSDLTMFPIQDTDDFSWAIEPKELLDFSANGLSHNQGFSEQWSESQLRSPDLAKMDAILVSSQAQSSYHSTLSLPPNDCEMQNSPQQFLGSPAKNFDSVLSPAIIDQDPADFGMDLDDSVGREARAKRRKSQRFYCTAYPPCNLSFLGSERLARHIR